MPPGMVINYWMSRLESGPAWLRRDACRRLEQAGEAHAIPSLIARLADVDATVQAAAARALGTLGDARALEPLLALLGDRNREVRRAVAQALGRLRDARAIEPLLPLLDDRSIVVRAAAAEALGALGEARAYEPLLTVLGNPDRGIRKAASRGLGLLRDPRAIEALTTRLQEERRAYDVRATIYEALGQIGGDVALQTLLGQTIETSLQARDAVYRALGELGDTRAVAPLLERFAYDPHRMPPAAQAALARLGQEPLISALTAARRGNEAPLLALAHDGNAVVAPILLRWFTRVDPRMRRAACRVLGELRESRAISPLVKCLDDDVPEVRMAACTALGQVGTAREAAKVAANIGDTAPAVRQAAMAALEQLGQGELAAALRAMFAGAPEALAMLLVAGEQPVTRPLVELLAATRFDLALQRALIGLFQRVWDAQEEAAPCMFCRPCLLRPTPREYRRWLAGRARVLTCRGCGAVLHFKQDVREVVAVLDSRETKAVTVRKGIARVYWPQREAPCDFDRVEILAADDYAVERFCMSAGNDTDAYRAQRRRSIPVTVACALSENTLRVLDHIFGTVRVTAE